MKKKKLFVLLTSFVLMIGVILSSITPFMIKAATINYSPFEYLISVESIDDTNQYNATIVGKINQGVLSPYNEVIIVHSDSQHVLNVGDYYLCKLVYDVSNIYTLDTNFYILFDDYIQMGFNHYYSDGYSAGVSATDFQAAYDSGYEIGQRDRDTYWQNKQADLQSEYQQELSDQKDYYLGLVEGRYQDGVQDGKILGRREVEEEIQQEEVEQATVGFKFTNLLNTIFMYPVRVFKEAFDVEIFGLNVGNILLTVIAVSIISLVFFLIRRFLK